MTLRSDILVGDSRKLLKEIPDQTFQMRVTNPPYWGLRDYGIKGQVGAETTVDAYYADLVAIFREVPRTLRDDGTLWLNIGDSYTSGGRVVAGVDTGFLWVNFGFGLIRNLEMLQEAGFSTTLEALDAATSNSAEHLGMQAQIGSIEAGKLADLAILERDPLTDLKAFYGTGTLSLQPDGTTKKAGGVKYTIKDGVVYDAKALLAEVAGMVRQARTAQKVSE